MPENRVDSNFPTHSFLQAIAVAAAGSLFGSTVNCCKDYMDCMIILTIHIMIDWEASVDNPSSFTPLLDGGFQAMHLSQTCGH